MIETLKIQGDGYLVNGTMSVPAVDGNRHYEEVKRAIAGGNEEYPTPIAVDPEFTQAELDKQAQDVINAEAQTYLYSTDWYIIREQETGVVVPQAILDARAEARLKIVQVP